MYDCNFSNLYLCRLWLFIQDSIVNADDSVSEYTSIALKNTLTRIIYEGTVKTGSQKSIE